MEGGLDRDHDISMPTKLTQLRYSGYSAEFLDRVEPNGNIPGKNGTSIAGRYLQCTYALQQLMSEKSIDAEVGFFKMM